MLADSRQRRAIVPYLEFMEGNLAKKAKKAKKAAKKKTVKKKK